MKLKWVIYIFICLLFLLPNAQAKLDDHIEYKVERGPECISPVDFDNDGDQDLVMICNGDMEKSASCIQYLINDGKGNFKNSTENQQNKPYLLDCSDMDGDNDIDMVILDDESINLLTNDGSGQFTNTWSYKISTFLLNSLKTLDLDGDNKNDIAFFDSINLHLFLTKTAEDYTYSKIKLNKTSDIEWFDMDKDGDLDIVTTYSGMKLFGELMDSPRIDVYKNNGEGNFEHSYNDEPEYMPGSIIIGQVIKNKISVFIQDFESNDILIFYWESSRLKEDDKILNEGEYDSIDEIKLFDINNDNALELIVLRSIDVINKVIRIYDMPLSTNRKETDITVSSGTTDFCILKADNNNEWDLAGMEGSRLMSGGEKVWILKQKKESTTDGDEKEQKIEDIILSPIFMFLIIIIVVVLVVVVVYFKKRKKRNLDSYHQITQQPQQIIQPQQQTQVQQPVQQPQQAIQPPPQQTQVQQPVQQPQQLTLPQQATQQIPVQQPPQQPQQLTLPQQATQQIPVQQPAQQPQQPVQQNVSCPTCQNLIPQFSNPCPRCGATLEWQTG